MAVSTLDGRKIIVTRPVSQAGGLIEELRALNAEVLELPLLAIKPLTEIHDPIQTKRIVDCISKLDHYDHAIFISSNAVHNGFHWIASLWPILPVKLQWYAIGKATLAALNSNQIDAITAGLGMNSEALLTLPALQSVQKKKIVIFRGVGGREYLAQQLRQRGAEVTYCELYQREVVSYTAGILCEIFADSPSLVTANSVETVTALLALAVADNVNEKVKELPIVVPGERVAKQARSLGFERIVCAANASDSAILASICRCFD